MQCQRLPAGTWSEISRLAQPISATSARANCSQNILRKARPSPRNSGHPHPRKAMRCFKDSDRLTSSRPCIGATHTGATPLWASLAGTPTSFPCRLTQRMFAEWKVPALVSPSSASSAANHSPNRVRATPPRILNTIDTHAKKLPKGPPPAGRHALRPPQLNSRDSRQAWQLVNQEYQFSFSQYKLLFNPRNRPIALLPLCVFRKESLLAR